jgi:hypothetical protein
MGSDSGDPSGKPAGPILTRDMILGNFALAAALFTALVAGCSLAYMLGYFGAFDSRSAYQVLQFVQYADVLQFAFSISANILFVFCGFGLLTAELSKRFRRPLARIDAQTVATLIVTPLAVWLYLVANKYRPQTAVFFLAMILLVGIISVNIAWWPRALKLHRLIPTLCLTFLALAILGLYFGGAAREGRRFQVSIADAKPRSLHLIAALSRGYMFFDESNEHIIFVPEREVRLVEHEPQD